MAIGEDRQRQLNREMMGMAVGEDRHHGYWRGQTWILERTDMAIGEDRLKTKTTEAGDNLRGD